MAKKYIEWNDAEQTNKEVEGLQESSGAADAGKIPALNAKGEIDKTMLPNIEIKTRLAAENLTAGQYVYIDAAEEVNIASADVGGNPTFGYVEDTVLAGASVDVYFDGTNASLSALIPGDEYFLSDVTPGAVVNTAPVGANKIIQSVGYAISPTEIQTNFSRPIKRA